MTPIGNIWKWLTSILSNLDNFHSLEVVDRVSETQLQVGLAVKEFMCLLGIVASGTDLSWVKLVLALIGKFGITDTFAIIVIYNNELFPTTIR